MIPLKIVSSSFAYAICRSDYNCSRAQIRISRIKSSAGCIQAVSAVAIGGVDVITELIYASPEAFEHGMEIATRLPVSKRIAADQDYLVEPDGIRITLVDERTR